MWNKLKCSENDEAEWGSFGNIKKNIQSILVSFDYIPHMSDYLNSAFPVNWLPKQKRQIASHAFKTEVHTYICSVVFETKLSSLQVKAAMKTIVFHWQMDSIVLLVHF